MKLLSQLILLILFLNSTQSIAGKWDPEKTVKKLNQALINQETDILYKLLHKDLSYGHSNLWIEDKATLINNNSTAHLKYKFIEIEKFSFEKHKRNCIVRYYAKHNVVLHGKELNLNLHVMQVWVKQGCSWKLLARQSVKIN